MKTELLLLIYVLFQIVMTVAIRRWISDRNAMHADKATSSSGGSATILTTGKTSRRVAWGVLLVFVLFIIIPILDSWKAIEGFSWTSVAFGAAWLIGGGAIPWLLVVWVYGQAFLVGKTGITKISPWRGVTNVQWNEITAVRFVPLYDMFVVKSTRGRMSISPLLMNIDSFASGILKNVPKEMWQEAETNLRKALSGPYQPDW